MKKTFQILGAAMLALAVVGCENEPIDEGTNTPVTPDEPSIEEPAEFALYATLPATRTTLTPEENGYKLEWSKGDDLAVFNAPTGTADYSENLKFVIDEEATGKFTPAEGVVVPYEEGVNYDWYVLAPHRDKEGVAELTTPKGQSSADGYFPIGAQTQNGYNNSDHVSSQDIMVGKATNTREPNVTLKHLAVLHKFTVTNKSDKPTIIQKLTVTGNTNIFGAFWIDLTADEPKIDLTKANNTADSFKTRALTIGGALDEEGNELAAEELPVGESADFYMITAPFTLATGETFKVTITTSTGEQTLEKTATKDIEFAAGTYNTANLSFEGADPVPVFLDDFGNSASSIGVKDHIVTHNYNNANIVVSITNGASYTTAGHSFNGAALRFSSSKDGSLVKYTGVDVNGNAKLTVSYNLALNGDSANTTNIAFKYRNTGDSKWITAQTTTLTAEEKGIVKDIKFDIDITNPDKTIEFYLSSSAKTAYAYLDNLKLDVPASAE